MDFRRINTNHSILWLVFFEQKDMKIPSKLIPYCPICGNPMTVNLHSDSKFVQDKGWYDACERYEAFIKKHKNNRILFLELGVGSNTPVIIKYPFWRFTSQNPKASYVCINYGEAYCPPQIEKKSICISEDVGKVLSLLNPNSPLKASQEIGKSNI